MCYRFLLFWVINVLFLILGVNCLPGTGVSFVICWISGLLVGVSGVLILSGFLGLSGFRFVCALGSMLGFGFVLWLCFECGLLWV